jgi:hypothetical protein
VHSKWRVTQALPIFSGLFRCSQNCLVLTATTQLRATRRHSWGRCRTPARHRPAARVEVWSLLTLWKLSTASSLPNDPSALMLVFRWLLGGMTTWHRRTAEVGKSRLHANFKCAVVSTMCNISGCPIDRAWLKLCREGGAKLCEKVPRQRRLRRDETAPHLAVRLGCLWHSAYSPSRKYRSNCSPFLH